MIGFCRRFFRKPEHTYWVILDEKEDVLQMNGADVIKFYDAESARAMLSVFNRFDILVGSHVQEIEPD
jgi:hypothetical protein